MIPERRYQIQIDAGQKIDRETNRIVEGEESFKVRVYQMDSDFNFQAMKLREEDNGLFGYRAGNRKELLDTIDRLTRCI